MADIARILAEVQLEADKAIATWRKFGDEGVKQFERLGQEANKASGQVNSAMGKIGSSVSAFGKGMQQVGQTMSIALTAPLTLFARTAINAYTEAAKGAALLEAQHRNVADTIGVTAEEMLAFADATQESTAFSDDAVVQMQQTLLKFTKVTGDEFKEAREVIMDFATATGQDLPAAADAVGRALQDPIQGLRALKQAGIDLSAAQRNQIQMWVETGQIVKAQQFILDQYRQRFAGMTAEFAKTDVGKAEMAFNRLDDALEGVGQKLLPIKTAIINFFADLIEGFNALPEPLQELIITIGTAVAGLGPLLIGLGALVRVIGFAMGGLGPMLPLLLALGPAAVVFAGGLWAMAEAAGGWNQLLANVLKGFTVFLDMLPDFMVPEGMVEKMAKAALMAQKMADESKDAAEGVGEIGKQAETVENPLNEGSSAASNLEGSLWDSEEAASNLSEINMGVLSGSMDSAKGSADALAASLRDAAEAARELNRAQAEGGGGGHAFGGMIFGPSGMDNVPAWLTAGEYVHRVAAVRKYGRGFMHAVNTLRFPTALTRGYAAGGLVGAPQPRFAGGGAGRAPVGQQSRPLTLVIGGEEFTGLRAPADTADELVRYSREHQLRATGILPSWVR